MSNVEGAAPQKERAMADNLPPLPMPNHSMYALTGYTAKQMRAYALAARQQAQVPDGLCERICAAIKAADDKSVDEAGYMLDSNDCIAIVREEFAAAPKAAQPEQAQQSEREAFEKLVTKMGGMTNYQLFLAGVEHAEQTILARLEAVPHRGLDAFYQSLHWTTGWNDCRAAMLAAAGGGQAPAVGDAEDAARFRWQYSGAKTDSGALVSLEIRLLSGDVPTLDEVRAAFDEAMASYPPVQGSGS